MSLDCLSIFCSPGIGVRFFCILFTWFVWSVFRSVGRSSGRLLIPFHSFIQSSIQSSFEVQCSASLAIATGTAFAFWQQSIRDDSVLVLSCWGDNVHVSAVTPHLCRLLAVVPPTKHVFSRLDGLGNHHLVSDDTCSPITTACTLSTTVVRARPTLSIAALRVRSVVLRAQSFELLANGVVATTLRTGVVAASLVCLFEPTNHKKKETGTQEKQEQHHRKEAEVSSGLVGLGKEFLVDFELCFYFPVSRCVLHWHWHWHGMAFAFCILHSIQFWQAQ